MMTRHRALTLVAASAIAAGCAAPTPFHDRLMTTQELAAADCTQLALEQKRVQDNAAHLAHRASEAESDAAMLAALGSLAQARGASHTGGSASRQAMQQARIDAETSRALQQKSELIGQLRSRKGCPR